MKKTFSLLLSASLLLIPYSASAGSENTQPHKLTILNQEDAKAIGVNQPDLEIGTEESRTLVAKEQAVIKVNPNGYVDSSGKIFTDTEVKKLSKNIKATTTEETPLYRPDAIIGTDNREQITNTTVFPYKRITYLKIVLDSSGLWTWCTGAIIDDDTVLTAAHCLYDNKAKRYYNSVTVYPGKNGSTNYYGSVNGNQLIVTNKYAGSYGYSAEIASYDYAVVKVPDGTFTAAHGFFQLKEAEGINTAINVTGYPEDKPTGTMWRSLGNITGSTSDGNDVALHHNSDTIGGMSGSPAFNSPDGTNMYIVGVHSGGNSITNNAADITSTSLTNINTWKGL